MGMRAGAKDEPGGLAETRWAPTPRGPNITVRACRGATPHGAPAAGRSDTAAGAVALRGAGQNARPWLSLRLSPGAHGQVRSGPCPSPQHPAGLPCSTPGPGGSPHGTPCRGPARSAVAVLLCWFLFNKRLETQFGPPTSGTAEPSGEAERAGRRKRAALPEGAVRRGERSGAAGGERRDAGAGGAAGRARAAAGAGAGGWGVGASRGRLGSEGSGAASAAGVSPACSRGSAPRRCPVLSPRGADGGRRPAGDERRARCLAPSRAFPFPQRAPVVKQPAWLAPAPQRLNSGLPVNIGVLFVPQQEAWVVERMGKFHRILEPVRSRFSPLLDPAGS